jgi:hypothetical protein
MAGELVRWRVTQEARSHASLQSGATAQFIARHVWPRGGAAPAARAVPSRGQPAARGRNQPGAYRSSDRGRVRKRACLRIPAAQAFQLEQPQKWGVAAKLAIEFKRAALFDCPGGRDLCPGTRNPRCAIASRRVRRPSASSSKLLEDRSNDVPRFSGCVPPGGVRLSSRPDVH